MRLAFAITIVLCSAVLLQAADIKELHAAKVRYVRQTDAARVEYLKILDADIARLADAGELESTLKLRNHRGEFLLGLEAVDEFRKAEGDKLSSELSAGAEKFVVIDSETRSALNEAYGPAIMAALSAKDVDAAERLKREVQSLASGEYAPSATEVDRTPPLEGRRAVLDQLYTVPLYDSALPDDLSITFQAQRARIAGVCRSDVLTLNGQIAGHFGKVVLIPPPGQGRVRQRHGYVLVGVQGTETQYWILAVSRDKLAYVLPITDLELNAVHEWTATYNRREVVIEVRRNGKVVKSKSFPGNLQSVIAFSATVRYPGQTAHLVVAAE